MTQVIEQFVWLICIYYIQLIKYIEIVFLLLLHVLLLDLQYINGLGELCSTSCNNNNGFFFTHIFFVLDLKNIIADSAKR